MVILANQVMMWIGRPDAAESSEVDTDEAGVDTSMTAMSMLSTRMKAEVMARR